MRNESTLHCWVTHECDWRHPQRPQTNYLSRNTPENPCKCLCKTNHLGPLQKGKPRTNKQLPSPQNNWHPQQNFTLWRPTFLPDNYHVPPRQMGWNPPYSNSSLQYNSSNAPRWMQNTAVPMDLSCTRAFNHRWGGRNNFRGGRSQYVNNQPTNCFQGNVTTTENSSNTCFQCRQTGHYARECPQRQ